MERLTGKHYHEEGYYMVCSGTCHKEDSECGDCAALDALVDRLGAYEDTGLTPEDVKEWIIEEKAVRIILSPRVTDRLDAKRLEELVYADTEGRLVALPDVGTEWLSAWEAGATCTLECPNLMDGKRHCDICEHGVLTVTQRRENFCGGGKA